MSNTRLHSQQLREEAFGVEFDLSAPRTRLERLEECHRLAYCRAGGSILDTFKQRTPEQRERARAALAEAFDSIGTQHYPQGIWHSNTNTRGE